MISWEHIFELAMQFVARPKLKNKEALKRFIFKKNQYDRICNTLLQNKKGSVSYSVGYDWSGWAANVRRSFQTGVPLGFLSHPTVSHTMVYGRHRGVVATRERVKIVESVYERSIADCLLREDYIGLPTISNLSYLTSANRAHHAAHLARYRKTIGENFWDSPSIIEWGGGYGNMACIIRRINPGITYTIIDLPEMLSLQYIYLSSIFGDNSINIALNINVDILDGRINLVTSQSILDNDIALNCYGFLSTWALTESPKEYQTMIIERNFFGAKRILIGSMINKNNIIKNIIRRDKIQTINVPTGFGIGSGNEYWFR